MKIPLSYSSEAPVLRTDRETYDQQKEALLRQYEGKFVLIHGTEVLGSYHCQMDAITVGYERLGNVPFLVKEVVRVEEPIFLPPWFTVR